MPTFSWRVIHESRIMDTYTGTLIQLPPTLQRISIFIVTTTRILKVKVLVIPPLKFWQTNCSRTWKSIIPLLWLGLHVFEPLKIKRKVELFLIRKKKTLNMFWNWNASQIMNQLIGCMQSVHLDSSTTRWSSRLWMAVSVSITGPNLSPAAVLPHT